MVLTTVLSILFLNATQKNSITELDGTVKPILPVKQPQTHFANHAVKMQHSHCSSPAIYLHAPETKVARIKEPPNACQALLDCYFTAESVPPLHNEQRRPSKDAKFSDDSWKAEAG